MASDAAAFPGSGSDAEAYGQVACVWRWRYRWMDASASEHTRVFDSVGSLCTVGGVDRG